MGYANAMRERMDLSQSPGRTSRRLEGRSCVTARSGSARLALRRSLGRRLRTQPRKRRCHAKGVDREAATFPHLEWMAGGGRSAPLNQFLVRRGRQVQDLDITPLLALAKKRAFLAGEGAELGGEVFDVSRLGRQFEDESAGQASGA